MAELELSLLANTRQFQKGTADAAMALDGVADSLNDVARDGEKSGERLERSFREIADAAKRESKKVGDSFQANSKRGFGRAGDAARSFKDEARQNFAEVASSFDGTTQGIADGIQGTLGGAAVAVGGAAGLALGTLGIIGGAVLQRIMEDAEASEKRVEDMYSAFIESGLTYLTKQQKIDASDAITGDPAKLAAAEQQAKDLGVTIQDVILAQVSAGEERNRVQQRNNELLAEAQQKLEDGTITTSDNLTNLEAYAAQYVKLNAEQADAARAAEVLRTVSEQITGQQKLTNEEIQIQNRLLSQTKNPKLEVEVDTRKAARDLKNFAGLSYKARLELDLVDRLGNRVV